LSEKVETLTEQVSDLVGAQRETDERLKETDERLNALINTVERYISEGRGGKSGG
jgi:ABC-type transporter Mla subunit MlaD